MSIATVYLSHLLLNPHDFKCHIIKQMIDVDTLDVVWHEMADILSWDKGPTNVIYCVMNKISKKRYVGLTSGHFKTRVQGHVGAALKPGINSLLYYGFQKYGLENFKACVLEIVSSNKSLQQAEIYWISELKSFYYDNPDIGLNMTLGGDGQTGYVTSSKTRQKQSLAKKGKPMSKSARKRLQKPVVQLELLTDKIINVFPSITAALNETGVTCITFACQGKLPHAGGFKWKYLYESDAKRGLHSEKAKKNRSENGSKEHLKSPVIQFNLETNEIIAEYSSIREAFQQTRIKNISMVCRGVRTNAGGFGWRYSEKTPSKIEKYERIYEPVTEEIAHPFDKLMTPSENKVLAKQHTPVSRVSCPKCNLTFGQEVRFISHLLNDHNIENSFQLFLDTYYNGVHPTCECSEDCQEKLTWNCWKKGFTSKYVRGHNARVFTSFSIPENAKKMANKRREGYQSGKYKVWNDGLTKETDERVAKISKSLSNKVHSQFM